MEPFEKTTDGVEVFAVTIRPQLPSHLLASPDAEVWSNCRAVFITYGATLQQLWLPGHTDTRGQKTENLTVADCVLGYPDVASYEKNLPHHGACIGRVAGRIRAGKFSLPVDLGSSISVHNVSKNLNNEHCLHGGWVGLTYRVWKITEIKSDSVKFSVFSPHGEDGFPGNLTVDAIYTIKINEKLGIDLHMGYQAFITDHICPINLTNHAYYNLSGHLSGSNGLYRHIVSIKADNVCEFDEELFPTGRMVNVKSLPGIDLQYPTTLKGAFTANCTPPFLGFDHFYVFNAVPDSEPKIIVNDPISGRKLEVFTDQVGVQFYSGNFLDPKIDPVGKDGFRYPRHGGICMETQGFPDAVNQINFPKVFVSSDKPYSQKTIFTFSC